MTDDLTLVVGASEVSGWQEISVSRGIEQCPNIFDISMTERFPGEEMVVVQPGDACTVYLGTDPVVTGYIDHYAPFLREGQHGVTVRGRGKCQDLVDCSAEWPGAQIVNSAVLDIAQKLAAPYGIEVIALTDTGAPVPLLAVLMGETPFEIIERVCRFAALLVYEDALGRLVLSAVGTQKGASGFQEGVNVEGAVMTYAMDQRFSEYLVVPMNIDMLQDTGDGPFLISKATDPGVPRHRRRVIVAEGGDPGYQIAAQRGAWECSRRFGRSAQLQVTTDSWRDMSGALYAPNTLVDLNMPSIKCAGKTWLISGVNYKRDEEEGTQAELVIMPPAAFSPAPIILAPSLADVPAQ